MAQIIHMKKIKSKDDLRRERIRLLELCWLLFSESAFSNYVDASIEELFKYGDVTELDIQQLRLDLEKRSRAAFMIHFVSQFSKTKTGREYLAQKLKLNPSEVMSYYGLLKKIDKIEQLIDASESSESQGIQ